ncbi:MAG: 50S ribosomal protein L15 [Candidatus Omnitrophica bacterium]|nr:50S ribosomal protein L15 [Candidatus Omnitrophota bacterium]MCM8798077.1 50S ribosomal protein L15 [Candidatus Omnitrophota bacterium]
MKIHELKPKTKRKSKKRLGRGPGSGHGKTSGRGHKGQKARTGFELRPGFEGGQMPLMRRIPKRGFVNRFPKEYQVVNLGRIEEKFEKNERVTPELLKTRGLIHKLSLPVKILGEGELHKPLTICAHKFSKQAVEKIKKAEASFEIIGG